ncbi:MAG: FKBP-type peptidyl-prolyl cis-trans isomerase [Verrucomicrobiota bacterium]|nr:FKBP-type peptidyl-prolyl cis-trans isomerase [Verrucomicrobiota bacterium]
MKSTSHLLALLLGLGVAAGLKAEEAKPNPSGQSSPSTSPATQKAKPFTDEQLAETLGWFVGKNSGVIDLDLNQTELDAFVRGLRAAATGKDVPYDVHKIGLPVQMFMDKRQTAHLAKAKQTSAAENAEFFAKLKQNKNVVELPDGLRYEIIKPGTGPYPRANQIVRVNYTGKLLNGKVFDASQNHGGATEFQLGRVIPGWAEGIQKINKGGKIRLYIPANLAYGDESRDPIPPGSTLIFDIELLDIKNVPLTLAPSTK